MNKIEYCFNPFNLFRWTKLEVNEWIWDLLMMTFSISFPSMLRRIMGQKILSELYTSLFGLGIMIDINFMKYKGQNLRLIQVLAMLTKLVIHLLLVIKNLRWFYDKWSSSRRDELLHFLIVSVNSVLEKGGHSDWGLDRILSSNFKLIWWFWAELKVWERACQKSSNSIYGYPLNWIASMTGN